jgi:hypothetical protein
MLQGLPISQDFRFTGGMDEHRVLKRQMKRGGQMKSPSNGDGRKNLVLVCFPTASPGRAAIVLFFFVNSTIT